MPRYCRQCNRKERKNRPLGWDGRCYECMHPPRLCKTCGRKELPNRRPLDFDGNCHVCANKLLAPFFSSSGYQRPPRALKDPKDNVIR